MKIMMKEVFKNILHFLQIFLLSLAIVLPIRYFVVQPFLVRGESMLPTFNNFDYLFVERVSYYVREPARGEVIVFRFPRNERDYYIKRVVGLPGEEVRIEGGQVQVITLQGKTLLLKEPYLSSNTFTQGGAEVRLGPGEYYVLGDNRDASYDSRRWGVLPAKDIIGRVLARIWPPNKAKAFWGEEFMTND
ncbi:MAG: signal peptidase I [Candidatus Portnoybacteria bacterium]|nr:signal peptidase I [Candidatus Portnoybacteria bacterium]